MHVSRRTVRRTEPSGHRLAPQPRPVPSSTSAPRPLACTSPASCASSASPAASRPLPWPSASACWTARKPKSPVPGSRYLTDGCSRWLSARILPARQDPDLLAAHLVPPQVERRPGHWCRITSRGRVAFEQTPVRRLSPRRPPRRAVSPGVSRAGAS